MLKIFNELEPFFEDVFREISVRQYAKLTKISPPTASKTLKNLTKEDLLKKKQDRIYLIFRANRENHLFKDLAITYWKDKLFDITKKLQEKLLFKNLVLFGSIAKLENTINSDIDIFVDISKKELDLTDLEKKLNRKIQIHFKEALNNPNLKKNIEKGVIIR